MYELWWRFSRLQNSPYFFCPGQEHGKGQTKSWGEGENKVWDWESRDNPQKSEKQLWYEKKKYREARCFGVSGPSAVPVHQKINSCMNSGVCCWFQACKMAEFITINQTVLSRRLRRIYSVFTMPTNLMETSKIKTFRQLSWLLSVRNISIGD